MDSKTLQSNLVLLLAAIIWGLAIVAQRVGAQYIGAFTFNGLRFALGSLSLLPFIYLSNKKKKSDITKSYNASEIKEAFLAGIGPGTVLFFASSFQQIGLAYTSAGKAAFITGLYILIVPLLGMLFKQRVGLNTWFGAVLAVVGLYYLTSVGNFSISKGDFLELIGSFFWALHILLIGYFSKKTDPLMLSVFQFAICALLSLITALLLETVSVSILKLAIIPILYGGICSVGIAYTLQVIGQKHAPSSHAAIILSMEVVIGAFGGWLILHENLGTQGVIGGILMFSGMLLSQLPGYKKPKAN